MAGAANGISDRFRFFSSRARLAGLSSATCLVRSFTGIFAIDEVLTSERFEVPPTPANPDELLGIRRISRVRNALRPQFGERN